MYKAQCLKVSGLLLGFFLTGCRMDAGGGRIEPVLMSAVPTSTLQTPYIELTYPQSDDQGHYVSLPQLDEVVVSGISAARYQPKGIIINGITVKPYLIKDIAPFGTPAGYKTYGFSLSMAIKPTTIFNIVLQESDITTPTVTFTPDEAAYSRLLSLVNLSPQTPLAHYRLGNALLARQSYNDAINAYNRSLEIRPNFVWGYDGLGQTYLQMKRPVDAELQFKKAKKLRPKWASPHYRLAEIYNSQELYDYAIVEYRAALKLKPVHSGVYRGYAIALYNKGYYQEAWNQLHLAEKNGAKLPVDFVENLRERMPEPLKNATAPGLHVKNQTNKHEHRQDNLQQPGPHTSGQTNKHSKGK